jgi:hypothetical protein
MFGNDFFKNTMLCFTKFAQDKRTMKDRQSGKKMSKESLIDEYKGHFYNNYEVDLADSQFIFIDNGIGSDPDAEPAEIKSYESALRQIKDFTLKNEPFFCRDIKEVMKDN